MVYMSYDDNLSKQVTGQMQPAAYNINSRNKI